MRTLSEQIKAQKLSSLQLGDFITEVVNDRAQVDDSQKHFSTLLHHYQEDMPYGTQKARDGDPAQWLAVRLVHDFPEKIERRES